MNTLDYTKIIYYKIFFEVAKQSSYTKAANNLSLSPTLITKDIMKFEKELGLKLFDRTTRQVCLTPAGEYLYLHSQKIIEELEDCYKKACRVQSALESTVSIGAMNTADLDLYFFPYINSFQKENPGMRLSIASDYMIELVNGLENNEYDLVVVPDFLINLAEERGFTWQWWAKATSTVIMSEENPLAQQEAVTLSELGNQTFSILAGNLNDVYERYIRSILQPYNKNIKVGRFYKNAYTLRDTFRQEDNSVIFTDAFFVYSKQSGFKRLPVWDHESGAIVVWKQDNRTAEKFLSWFSGKHTDNT